MTHASAARKRSGTAITIGVGAAVTVALGFALWPSTGNPRSEETSSLPRPARPALAVPEPEPLGDGARVSLWSFVRRAATARTEPSRASTALARLARSTPEGTANTLLVLGRARDASGRVWVRARLPVLPNGTTGWLPRKALGGYRAVSTRLVVNLRRLRATLLRNGRPVMRADIGIGLDQWPTPRGRFYIRNKLVRYRSAFYGPLAFGTSARSAVLTDWPDGGFIGIHGTNRPELLPGRVSHGCIRMRNADIVRLGRLMPVGTPMEVS
jgi:L,D-transpeptidase catalytic domain